LVGAAAYSSSVTGCSHWTTSARARAWPVALLAFGAWFLGLVPWILTRSTTGTFGTPWKPRNHLRDALLPFHYQRLPLLLVVVVVAGALAGLAPWWYRERSRHRVLMSSLATVGAVAATAYAVWQTVGPSADVTRWLGSLDVEQLGCILLTMGGSLLGLLLGLATSLGGPVLRTLAASVLIVVGGGWLGQCVVASVGVAALPWLPWALVVLTGTMTGVLLAALGIHPRRRLLAWPAVGILVVLTTAALRLRGTCSKDCAAPPSTRTPSPSSSGTASRSSGARPA
jgi:hypothetical protein